MDPFNDMKLSFSFMWNFSMVQNFENKIANVKTSYEIFDVCYALPHNFLGSNCSTFEKRFKLVKLHLCARELLNLSFLSFTQKKKQ